MFHSSDPTGNDYETYLYGDIDPGWNIYTPGNELALRFESDSIDHGFQIVYYQADPGDTIYTMLWVVMSSKMLGNSRSLESGTYANN